MFDSLLHGTVKQTQVWSFTTRKLTPEKLVLLQKNDEKYMDSFFLYNDDFLSIHEWNQESVLQVKQALLKNDKIELESSESMSRYTFVLCGRNTELLSIKDYQVQKFRKRISSSKSLEVLKLEKTKSRT